MFWIVVTIYAALLTVCTVRIAAAGHAPAAAAAWILAIWCIPAAGLIIYILAAWHSQPLPVCAPNGQSFVESVITGGCGSTASIANRVGLLNDGGQMYSALIRELHRARQSIHLEYYIFDDDRTGAAIAEVLVRKARAGVRVRVLCDALGSRRLSRSLVRHLQGAGAEVCIFGPVRFPWLTPSLNIRNHRKIAVIDGSTAFIGGINIARRYLEGNELGGWRDEHLRIEGRAAACLQRLFADDWCRAGGTAFDVGRHIATSPPRPDGGVRVQIGWAQTGRTRRTLTDAFTAAIMQARRDIMISTPYFVPPQTLLRALCIASAGGVRVRLMVPSRADMRAAALAGRSYFAELLAAGTEIYLYDSGFLHSKMLVVDSRIVSVGTANFDCRSLCINWEVAAFVYDDSFARETAAVFERDLLCCRRLTRSQHDARPLPCRIAESFCRLFSPML